MKLYHAADIHLGRRRLDGRMPDDDFVAAFRFIVEEAIREKADVFLLTGDLFDRPQVEPPNLRQAQEVLRLLKNAGIPVIAIEGNHDKQFVNTDAPTWVRFLAEDDLLMLLRPEFHAEGVRLNEWNTNSRTGAWVEIDSVRFVGAGYLGAATPSKVRQIIEQMPAGKTQVLLLHAGPEFFVGEGGGFSKEDLQMLETKVCYLALGHIHKPMLYGGWACNPGSPENCDLREAGYSHGKDGKPVGRGYAVLEIDPSRPDQPVSLEIRSNPRRRCLRVELDCTAFGSKTKNGAAAFLSAAVEAIKEGNPDKTAVIELMLTGSLNLNRIALDLNKAAMEVAEQAGIFAVAIDTTRLNIGNGFAAGGSAGADLLPRDELERRAILQLVDNQPLWGLSDERQAFADLFYEVKELVRGGQTGEAIATQIGISPLIEKVRVASSTPKPVLPPQISAEPVAATEGIQ
ncbi:MAG TPA: DNA repair exonuclease [Clostridia bacterium]|nr:DNA repair exonuclease [Clostridia bacterium]